jgi:hypothetical protein
MMEDCVENKIVTIHDSEFGTINNRDDGAEWTLDRHASFGLGEVPVRVESEGTSFQISLIQREAVRLALALTPDILRLSAPAVVQNYDVYQDMLGDELPILSVPADVWLQVSLTYINVPIHHLITIPTFLLFAECNWDPEHGLVVRFRHGCADAANQQGELGIDR